MESSIRISVPDSRVLTSSPAPENPDRGSAGPPPKFTRLDEAKVEADLSYFQRRCIQGLLFSSYTDR